MRFRSVTVIGLGLLGGSVCRAIKKYQLSDEILGIDSDRKVVDFALKQGIINNGTTSPESDIGSDLVLIATYVDAIGDTFEEILPKLKRGCVVTDVGSVKSPVINSIDKLVNDNIYFVGSHPIAGTETPGIQNSDPELFKDKNVIITPSVNTHAEAIESVKLFWESIGSRVITMAPEIHDEVFAYVSHLPHVVAYALVNTVGSSDITDNIFSYSGGGLKDFTRIASSSPEMWKTIVSQNRDNILDSIKKFKINLENAESAIQKDDLNELLRIFMDAQKFKLSE